MEFERRFHGWPVWIPAKEWQVLKGLRGSYDDPAGVLGMLRAGVQVIGGGASYRLTTAETQAVPGGPGRDRSR